MSCSNVKSCRVLTSESILLRISAHRSDILCLILVTILHVMLRDVAIIADLNIVEKKQEKFEKYQDLQVEL